MEMDSVWMMRGLKRVGISAMDDDDGSSAMDDDDDGISAWMGSAIEWVCSSCGKGKVGEKLEMGVLNSLKYYLITIGNWDRFTEKLQL